MAKKLRSATAAVPVANKRGAARSLGIENLITKSPMTSWTDTKNKEIYGPDYTIVLNNAFDARQHNRIEIAECSHDFSSTAANI